MYIQIPSDAGGGGGLVVDDTRVVSVKENKEHKVTLNNGNR
jgi:hypothetical protein